VQNKKEKRKGGGNKNQQLSHTIVNEKHNHFMILQLHQFMILDKNLLSKNNFL